ncbi:MULTISPECIES: helix-turn-helix transcriptional regulator [Inquilinus]|uniref:AraC-like DNA-binding protein n=1 Tax=Inquilinus ginsengisoli TaxID=363840 RepID=A0ABU1JP15_9PROT|nr:helix-turn-helix transcriptional regulator [Inquilinus ginsengisoli]MDR6290361.1 AraC-like DNA-binding protein [Inquilinus ginsengisoli]
MRDSSVRGSILCAGADEHYQRLCQPLLDSRLESLSGEFAPAILRFVFAGANRAIHIRSGPSAIRRPAGLCARYGDHYLVLVAWSAGLLVAGERQWALTAGTVVAIDGNLGFELLLGEATEERHVVDWLHIAAPGPSRLRGAAGCVVLGSSMLAQYVSNHARLAVKGLSPDDPLAERIPVFDYIGRALEDYIAREGLGGNDRLELFRRIRPFIADNVKHPSLGADLIARRFGISKRKLYSVISSNGASLHEMIMTERLEAAHRAIEAGGEKVTSVILDHGFSNASTFYRNYKRQFGRTPRSG